MLATRYGVQAADLVMAGETGRMAALHGTEMTSVPLEQVEGIKTVDLRYLEIAQDVLRLKRLLSASGR